MTGVRITITDAELRRAIAGLSRLGRNPAPALEQVGEALHFSTTERQRAGRAPDGSAWPELNPQYKADKSNTEMLRESGRLMGSLSRQVQGRRLRFGTNVIYAAIHQFGGTIRAKGGGRLAFFLGGALQRPEEVEIPARPFLGISAEDREEIVAIFRDHAQRAMGGR